MFRYLDGIDKKSEAKRRLDAARERIAKLVGREDIGTEDPLMAEIQLAQLDAMLGIGYALAGFEGEAKFVIDQNTAPSRGYFNWLDERVTQMEDEIEKMAAAAEPTAGPAPERLRRFVPPEPPPEPKPWWKFW